MLRTGCIQPIYQGPARENKLTTCLEIKQLRHVTHSPDHTFRTPHRWQIVDIQYFVVNVFPITTFLKKIL